MTYFLALLAGALGAVAGLFAGGGLGAVSTRVLAGPFGMWRVRRHRHLGFGPADAQKPVN